MPDEVNGLSAQNHAMLARCGMVFLKHDPGNHSDIRGLTAEMLNRLLDAAREEASAPPPEWRERVADLRRLFERATPGPWEVQDGCSWRRIGTRGHDGNVLCPTNHPRDRHPDLMAGRGEDTQANLALIVAAVNALPELLEAVDSALAKADAIGGCLG